MQDDRQSNGGEGEDRPHGWLCLTRRPQESIAIGDDIQIAVVQIQGQQVRLAIRTPKDVIVLRSELIGKPKKVKNPSNEPSRSGSP